MFYKFNRKNSLIAVFAYISIFILMTSNVSSAEIDLTPPTISDVGHYPVNPTNTDSILFNCTVTDSSGINFVRLLYRINGSSWYFVDMTSGSAPNSYEYNFESFAYNVLVEYYIFAEDASASLNTATEDNGGLYYKFTVGLNDIVGPEIIDVFYLPATPNNLEQITVNCTVVDDYSDVLKVELFYRVNNSEWSSINFSPLTDEAYQVTFGPFAVNEYIEFYIKATDNSTNHNEVINDNLGYYYNFKVITITTETNPIAYVLPIIAVFSIVVLYKRRK